MTRIVNSRVISASLGKGRHIQLPQPVTIRLQHLRLDNVSNAQCVFWDYTVGRAALSFVSHTQTFFLRARASAFNPHVCAKRARLASTQKRKTRNRASTRPLARPRPLYTLQPLIERQQ